MLVSVLNLLLHWRTLCVFILSSSFSMRGSSTEMTFLSTCTHIRCVACVSIWLDLPGHFVLWFHDTCRLTLSPTSYSGRARSSIEKTEEIPSVCSQSIDTTVDVGILLVCSGSCQELCLTPMQHVLTWTTGAKLSKLAMSMHENACRWQCWSMTITCMAISSKRWAELRLRGRVRAWIEGCRVRASRCS